MAGSGRKIDELLEGAAEESYVSDPSSVKLRWQNIVFVPNLSDASCSASLRINFTTRLMELFKRRGDIEAQIIDHSRALEQAYTAANNELREVLKGKLEDIDEGLKGPKAAPPEAAHSS